MYSDGTQITPETLNNPELLQQFQSAQGGLTAALAISAALNARPRGAFIDVTEFDYTAVNEVIYQENGVTIRTIPAIHIFDGAVSFILEWNGYKVVFGGDTTGGPFGAAVFGVDDGRLVAPGVNLVLPAARRSFAMTAVTIHRAMKPPRTARKEKR